MKNFFSWIGGICMELGSAIMDSKFVRISTDIIVEAYYGILDIIGSNLRNVIIILRVGLPYLMLYLGAYLYKQRGKFTIGGEVFIPLIIFIVTYYIRQYANRIGKGERAPVPEKRFTEQGEEDGEYTVETNRIEEMILYMAKLEDWLQRKGLLK